ncbi:hypothetical protein R3P38DRAFT_3188899 [Favolaschia claudopus]|uniref:Uncharacterized protein n=1 Tax=Favolaschia claudopus TaxID=2862362 RepID=A0AAW0BUN6_9AGAR
MQTNANVRTTRSLLPIKYPAIPNDDKAEKRARRQAELIARRERAAARAAYYAANPLESLDEGIKEVLNHRSTPSTPGTTESDADAGNAIVDQFDEESWNHIWERLWHVEGVAEAELERQMQAFSESNWAALVDDVRDVTFPRGGTHSAARRRGPLQIVPPPTNAPKPSHVAEENEV